MAAPRQKLTTVKCDPLDSIGGHFLIHSPNLGDKWAFEICKQRDGKEPEPGVKYSRLIKALGPNLEQYPRFGE
jgi:hypothetical protein